MTIGTTLDNIESSGRYICTCICTIILMYIIMYMCIVCGVLYPSAYITYMHRRYIVEPLNKGHFGTNINYAALSFVERLSSSWRFKMY